MNEENMAEGDDDLPAWEYGKKIEPIKKYGDRVEQKADSKRTPEIRKTNLGLFAKWIIESEREFPTKGDGLQCAHAALIEGFLAHEDNRGISRSTMDVRWYSLRDFYKEASSYYRIEFLDESPFEAIGKRSDYLPSKGPDDKKKRVYITQSQKEALCEHARSPRFRNELIFRLMWQTGIRSSEVVWLKTDDVDLENNRLDEFWRPKIKDHHTVTFGEPVASMLDDYINEGYRDGIHYAAESDYLFPTDDGPQMHRTRPTRIIGAAAEDAGIQWIIDENQRGDDKKAISSHAFRRGHGMHLWKNDVDLHTIRQRLGHKSIEQTREYLPINAEDADVKVAGIQW